MLLQGEIASYSKVCEDAYNNSKKETAIFNRMWLDSPWSGFFDRRDPMKLPSTGISEEQMQHVGTVFSTEPGDNFTVHSGRNNVVGGIATVFMLQANLCRLISYFEIW